MLNRTKKERFYFFEIRSLFYIQASMFLTMIKDHVIKTEKARKMITGRTVGLESKKSDK